MNYRIHEVKTPITSAFGDTRRLLDQNFPKRLAHLRPALAKLPLSTIVQIVFGCTARNMSDDAVADAIQTAAAFHELESWRCPICFHWQRRINLMVVAVHDGQLSFHNVCPTCQQKHRTPERIREAMAAYVLEKQR